MNEIQSNSHQEPVSVPHTVALQGSRNTPTEGLSLVRELMSWHRASRWLLTLVRRRTLWSPVLISGELWRLLTNIRSQREIVMLMNLPPFDEIVRKNPRLAFKYLISDYLARGFSVAERASCFLHHYRRLCSMFSEDVLRQIMQGQIALHEISENGHHFAFTLSPPESTLFLDKEGELSLDLRVDGERVFTLSFTIVPGWVVKSDAAELLLITRLQGTRDCRDQIKHACKALHEDSPRTLLLAALQGVADAFGIYQIAGVCATRQVCYTEETAATLNNCYDDFFGEVGMVQTNAGVYSTSTPIEGRPLASYDHNRSRAKKRRTKRHQIHLACAVSLLEIIKRTSECTRCTVKPLSTTGTFESQPSRVSCATGHGNLFL